VSDQSVSQLDAYAAALEGLKEGEEKFSKSVRRTNAALSEQAGLAAQFSEMASNFGLDKLDQSIGGLEKSFKNASEAASQTRDEFSNLEEGVRNLTSEQERTEGAMKTFQEGLGRIAMGGKLLLNFLGSAVSGIFAFTKAILFLPFQLLGNLVEFAADGGGGNELREAYERVRETFGDLASGPARDLIDSFQTVRAQAGNMAESGMRLSRIFGVGPGGLAKAMDFIKDLAKDLGAQFQLLRGEFIESAADLIIFQKGMGLSNDQFKAFTTIAIANGDALTDTLGEVANMAIQLGDRFDLSAKEIAGNMATLASDFVTFGNLSQEELATTAVFAMRAGVSIESLTKITEKFKTFEDAAQSAAMLNQALGIQIDAMAMLTANPADQLSMLQQAFQATGKSVQDLNRAERELLATQTGLSGEELAAALAPENAGKSLEEIQAIAAGAAEAPLSTEEAMTRLADSIERVFESGGGMKSFFEAFSEGFEQGIRWFGPTRELFRNIRESLRVTRQAGRDFAQMFIADFPGITEIITSLRDAFDPAKFRKFLAAVHNAFKDFFTQMDPDNPSATIGSFFERIQSAFSTTFGGEGGSGILSKMKEGLSKIGEFLFNALLGALPHMTAAITYLLDQLTSILRSDGQSEIGAAFGEVMDSLGGVLTASWERLQPVLIEAFSNLWESLQPAFSAALTSLYENVIRPYGLWVVGAMLLLFAPQLAAGVLLQVVGAAISAVVATVGGALGGIASLLGLGSGGMLDGIKESLKKIGEIIDEIGKLNVSNIGKAIASMLKLAVFFTVGLGAFVAGVGAVYAIANAFGLFNDPTKLTLMLGVIATAIAGSIAIALAGNALAAFGPALLVSAGKGLLGGALLLTVGTLAFIGGLKLVMWAWDAAGLSAGQVLGTMAALGVTILTTAGIIAGAAAFGALLLTPGANLLFGAAFAAGVAGLATALVTVSTVLAPAIKSVVNAMSDVDPERGRVALEIFSLTLQAMQPITDIALAAMRIEDANPDSIARMVNSIMNSMMALLGSVSETVMSIVNALSGMGLSEEQMRSAQAVSGILGAFAQLMGSFPEPLELTNRQIRQLRRSDITGQELAELISGNGVISNMTALVEGIADQVPALGRAIATIGELNITEEGIRRIEAVSNLMGSMVSFYSELKDVTTDQVQSTIDAFGTIIEAYNDFYESISDLDSAVDINAAIERFGNSLGIRNQTVSVNNEPISVTVNLNVTMDAEDIAHVLTSQRRGRSSLVTAGQVSGR
jgi:hypothetical protein